MTSLPSNHDGLLVRTISKVGVNFSQNVGFISASAQEPSLLGSTLSDDHATSPRSSASNSPAGSPRKSGHYHTSSDESGPDNHISHDDVDSAGDRRNRRRSLNLGKMKSPIVSKKQSSSQLDPNGRTSNSSAATPVAPVRPKPSGSVAIAEKHGYWIENFDESPPPPDGEPLGQVSLFRIEDFNYHYHYHKYFFNTEHYNFTGVSEQVGPILVSISRQATYPNGRRTAGPPDTPTRSRTKSLSMAQGPSWTPPPFSSSLADTPSFQSVSLCRCARRKIALHPKRKDLVQAQQHQAMAFLVVSRSRRWRKAFRPRK